MTRTEILGLSASAAVVGLVSLPFFSRAREVCGPRGSCQSNLKQIGLAIHQYAQDNADRLLLIALAERPPRPTRAIGPYGWADALQPYLKAEEVFFCPQAPPPKGAARHKFLSTYYFNRQLAGRPLSKRLASITVLSGDGEVRDTRYNLGAISPARMSNPKSPLRRHKERSNILRADGSVKAWNPDEVAMMRFGRGVWF